MERDHSFPDAEALARAKKRELMACKLGFRWKFVRHVARKVASEELRLESLSNMPYSFVCNEAGERNIGQDIRSWSQGRGLRESLLPRQA